MRKIKWDEALTGDDIAWLRTAGFMSEEQIERHQAQFDAKVPEQEAVEVDGLTKSALDPEARMADLEPGRGDGAPTLVDPTQQGGVVDEVEDDDYDKWKMPELEAEISARNEMENTTDVVVEGTGHNGAIKKSDIIKGLRAWDAENPNALD